MRRFLKTLWTWAASIVLVLLGFGIVVVLVGLLVTYLFVVGVIISLACIAAIVFFVHEEHFK